MSKYEKPKSADDVLEELNRMPFFMTRLDDTDGEGGQNMELQALKALAYEGEPHEIAENFKNQGNGLYKVGRYKDAREIYSKGIEIKCGDSSINESLFANTAACEFQLKNYRKCINNCKNALKLNPKNVKCYYRMANSFLKLDKLDGAEQACNFGLQFDHENKPFQLLAATIARRKDELTAKQEKLEKEAKEREQTEVLLNAAVLLRGYKSITTRSSPTLLDEARMHLEDKADIESQLIFPATAMYPTTDEFDFIAAVGELSSPEDLLAVLLQRPQEWFEFPGHENFTLKKLIAYMETESGGLIKIGKKVSFHDVLKMEKPSVPLFDQALRIYFVPKAESEDWLRKWNKTDALKKRV